MKTEGRQRLSITQKGNHQCEIGQGAISKTDEAGGSAGISDYGFDDGKTLDGALRGFS